MHAIPFNYRIIFFLFILLCSCARVSEIPENKDITLTNYDTTADFKKYRSFVIRDSVLFVSLDGHSLSADQELQLSSIIPQISSQLIRRGYTQVSSISAADISINILLADISQSDINNLPELLGKDNINSYLDWYSGGYPVWGGFNGFWYPWRYERVQSSTGVILIEMADGQSVRNAINAGSENTGSAPCIRFLWQAILTGVYSGNGYDAAKSAKYIEEAFLQSEYLQK